MFLKLLLIFCGLSIPLHSQRKLYTDNNSQVLQPISGKTVNVAHAIFYKLYEIYFQPLSLFIGVLLWAQSFVFYSPSKVTAKKTSSFFNGFFSAIFRRHNFTTIIGIINCVLAERSQITEIKLCINQFLRLNMLRSHNLKHPLHLNTVFKNSTKKKTTTT